MDATPAPTPRARPPDDQHDGITSTSRVIVAEPLGKAYSPGRSVYEHELAISKEEETLSHSTHPLPDPAIGATNPELLNEIRSIFPSYNSSPSLTAPEFHSITYPLPTPNTPKSPFAGFESPCPEELAWWGSRVIWSRGSTIYRTFSYEQEKQKVTKVLFAWFTVEPSAEGQSGIEGNVAGAGDRSSEAEKIWRGVKAAMAPEIDLAPNGYPTFGPFHDSQHARWGRPDPISLTGGKGKGKVTVPQRCLVILLEDWAHVYYPGGQQTVFPLAFPIEDAWPIKDERGGMVLQRKIESQEKERIRAGRTLSNGRVKVDKANLDETMELLLEELQADHTEGLTGVPNVDEARLYSLTHPMSEMRPIYEVDKIVVGEKGNAAEYQGHARTFLDKMEVVSVESEELPLVVMWDHQWNSIVFYQWARMQAKPSWQHALPGPVEAEKDTSHLMDIDNMLDMPEPRSARSEAEKRSTRASLGGSKRKSVGGTRAGPTGSKRRVSFLPDEGKVSAEHDRHASTNALAALDSIEGLGARLRAEGDLVRDLPNDRRVSFGVGEGDKRLHTHAIPLPADADWRDTTMLFGVEQRNEKVEADLVLQEVFRAELPYEGLDGTQAKAFLSDQLSATDSHLNVWFGNDTSGTLTIFQVDGNGSAAAPLKITQVATKLAVAAIPITSTRTNVKDVLILNEGKLQVMSSHGRCYDIAVDFSSDEDEDLGRPDNYGWSAGEGWPNGGENEQLKALGRPVGSTFWVKTLRNTWVMRDINLVPDDITVNQLLYSLSCVLPIEIMADIKMNVLRVFATGEAKYERNVATFGRALLSTFGLLARPAATSSPSAWQQLVLSAREDRRLDVRSSANKAEVTGQAPDDWLEVETLEAVYAPYVMSALHTVAEELWLDQPRRKELSEVASIIIAFAQALQLPHWVDHWLRKVTPARRYDLASDGVAALSDDVLAGLAIVPDYADALGKAITTGKLDVPYDAISLAQLSAWPTVKSEYGGYEPTPHLALIATLYLLLTKRADSLNSDARAMRVVEVLAQTGLDERWLRRLPWSIALPIHEAIRQSRVNPGNRQSLQVYHVLDRMDIAAQMGLGFKPITMDPVMPHITADKEGLNDIRGVIRSVTNQPLFSADRRAMLMPTSKAELPVPNMRYSNDRRLWDVDNLLQTVRPRVVKPEDRPQLSEEERLQYHQSLLHSMAYRTTSQAIGYGVFLFASKTPSATQKFPLPPFHFGVQLLPSASVSIPDFKLEQVPWAVFHQGVGAGLSIVKQTNVVDSSWIFFNKPEHPTPMFGGFLFGLGLRGRLRDLATWHLYPNLTSRQDHTSIGLLLGMAASYAGSQDRRLTTMLSSGVGGLLPRGSVELNTSPLVQAASIFGLGLVHVGTGRRRLAETTLAEIGTRVLPGLADQTDHREGYAFSAACAFGLIMLGRGGHNEEYDAHCVEQLRVYSTPVEEAEPDYEEPSGASEGIDINLTASSAVFALGLMYLRTNRADIARRLRSPATLFELEEIRPDLLLIRSLAYNLIMWDDIKPTAAWLESQIPQFVMDAWRFRHMGHEIDEVTELAYFFIIAGASLALGLKYAGTLNEDAQSLLLGSYNLFASQQAANVTYEGKIRRIASRQGISIVAIALSLVFAGSGDLGLYRRFRHLHSQDVQPFGMKMALHMAIGLLHVGAGRYSFGNSNLAVAMMAISFYPRWTNALDDNKAYLQAYRHLWALAIEPRCVATADLDTLKATFLPMKMDVREGDGRVGTRSVVSPHLMSTLENVTAVSGASPRYTTPLLNFKTGQDQRQSLLALQSLFVKRKLSFLDYVLDPKGNRSVVILTHSLQTSSGDTQNGLSIPIARPEEVADVLGIVAEFTTNPVVNAFASAFGREIGARGGSKFSFAEASQSALLEAMLQDRSETALIYLAFMLDLGPLNAMNGPMPARLIEFASHYYSSPLFEDQHGAGKKAPRNSTIKRGNLVSAVQFAYKQLGVLRTRDNAIYMAAVAQTESVTGEAITSRIDATSSTVSAAAAIDRVPNFEDLLALRQNMTTLQSSLARSGINTIHRNAILRMVLRRLAARHESANERKDLVNPSPSRIWSEASMLDALREWTKA